MAYQHSKNSCNPFADAGSPCTLGSHVAYAVNATCASDFQAAIDFVRRHNIRLVIRNTGHDYLGRSTSAHALRVWTHYMKDIELLDVKSKAYAGSALKLGAGVEVGKAYSFANQNGLMVVGGNCPNVGITGDFTQGGGHGPLSSRFGLAAGQVLEFQVVTASGELVTASHESHTDLFWALQGGGGSTFGAVVPMTVKAYPDSSTSTAQFHLMNNGANTDEIYTLLRELLVTLPRIADAGTWVSWIAAPFGLMLAPVFAPHLRKAELDELFKPVIDKMDELNLEYNYVSQESPTMLAAYIALPALWNVSDYNLGGRLIPRSLVENDADAVVSLVRAIGSETLMSGVSFNVQKAVSNVDENAVNPYMRRSLFSHALGMPIKYTDWTAQKAAEAAISEKYLPLVRKATGELAAYVNEADVAEKELESAFFGDHYAQLAAIKEYYYPEGVFLATKMVESDQWVYNPDGRLCVANASMVVPEL